MDIDQAAEGFAAAGSRARLEVLQLLVRAGPGGLSVGEIQQRLQIAASTLAHHLKFLAGAGLIKQVKHGRSVINRAEYAHIEALAAFLLHECCAEAGQTEALLEGAAS
ncbi:MAG: transcriptional regulator [Hyphomicrobiales bacterium]|nr:MAG: transcriptional regulator [Hyphomicrobiales bacterium]